MDKRVDIDLLIKKLLKNIVSILILYGILHLKNVKYNSYRIKSMSTKYRRNF